MIHAPAAPSVLPEILTDRAVKRSRKVQGDIIAHFGREHDHLINLLLAARVECHLREPNESIKLARRVELERLCTLLEKKLPKDTG